MSRFTRAPNPAIGLIAAANRHDVHKFAVFLAFLVVSSAILYGTLMITLFGIDHRPDEVKAISDFYQFFFRRGYVFGDYAEPLLRLLLYSFCATTTVLLFHKRLISERAFVFASIWPMTHFLYTKVYWEFWVFPLCLIRHDIRIRDELVLCVAILLLYFITSEGNSLVLLAYRLVLLGQKMGWRRTLPLVVSGIGVLINHSFDNPILKRIPVIGQHIGRFDWTRDVANPEYTMAETLGVLLSSLHFFTLHTSQWIIDLTFTVLSLSLIFAFKEARSTIRSIALPAFAAFSVIILFTEITHAFQNFRYYFFMLPLLAHVTPPRAYLGLFGLGVVHVASKLIV